MNRDLKVVQDLPTIQALNDARELTIALKAFTVELAGNADVHAKMILDGPAAFKPIFYEAIQLALTGASDENMLRKVDKEELAIGSFKCLEKMWAQVHPFQTPAQRLEDERPSSDDPSPEEIDQAWEVEIGGSEAYMRRHWTGSARTRTGNLETLGQKRDPRHGI